MTAHDGARGYTSFSYLDPERDDRTFELDDPTGRAPAHPVELSPEQEARAEALAERCVTISLHDHLGLFPKNIDETPAYVREGRMATPFDALTESAWDAVFDNLMDGICRIHSHSGWQWSDVLHDLGMRLCDIAHQDVVVPARTADDVLRAHAESRLAWIPALEGAAMIENELDRIDLLYGFGVRMVGVTYSEANALGSGLKEPRDGGLTAFGRKAVERMNEVGMIIDCSHASDRTTLDVVQTSAHPVVLSHIGARALWPSKRLAPDEVLVEVAGKGGVIGIEAAPHTTITRERREHTIDSFMQHFEYVKGRVGIEHVAFGPDTLYGDHVGLHRVYAAGLSLDAATAAAAAAEGDDDASAPAGRASGADGAPADPADHPKVDYVRGLENPTEASHNILRWLVANGYSDDEIEKVMGGNILRVMRTVQA
ncbi:MAG: dipeptidase [Gemmatimonadota bacterium]